MKNYTGNVPSLSSSNAANQGEISKAKKRMNNAGAMQQGMTAGAGMGGTTMATPTGMGLTSSTAVGQQELQKAKQKVQQSGTQNPTTGLM